MFKVFFAIQYDNLCLLIEMHQPFIFNVIIDMLGLKSTFVLLLLLLLLNRFSRVRPCVTP